MKKRNLKKGFTIVELVIVIAVIAILSAVLIPTFSNVVSNANEAALKADAKAIYTEYVAWASENGEDVETEVVVKVKDAYYNVNNGVVEIDAIENFDATGYTQVVVEEAVEGCSDDCSDHDEGYHIEAKDAVKLNVWTK